MLFMLIIIVLFMMNSFIVVLWLCESCYSRLLLKLLVSGFGFSVVSRWWVLFGYCYNR